MNNSNILEALKGLTSVVKEYVLVNNQKIHALETKVAQLDSRVRVLAGQPQ